jgi:hypothetical protein
MSLIVVDSVGNPSLSRKRASTASNGVNRSSSRRCAVLVMSMDAMAHAAAAVVIRPVQPVFSLVPLNRPPMRFL